VSDYTEKSEKLTPKEKVTQFLTKYLNVIIAVGVIALVVIASMAIYSAVMSSRIEKSSVQAEELQSTFEEWKSAESEQKAELEKELIEQAEDIISSYGGLYAGARAHMVLAKMYVEKESWEDAEGEYLTVADSFPESYLAPVALMSAAACREEVEDYEGALELYREVESDYAETSPAAPHALFSIGRLNEELDNREAALEAYNGIVDDFSSSNWTKPARSRIIYLESN
jgi:predicted negative regulator of RcsB-dependent stress response